MWHLFSSPYVIQWRVLQQCDWSLFLFNVSWWLLVFQVKNGWKLDLVKLWCHMSSLFSSHITAVAEQGPDLACGVIWCITHLPLVQANRRVFVCYIVRKYSSLILFNLSLCPPTECTISPSLPLTFTGVGKIWIIVLQCIIYDHSYTHVGSRDRGHAKGKTAINSMFKTILQQL